MRARNKASPYMGYATLIDFINVHRGDGKCLTVATRGAKLPQSKLLNTEQATSIYLKTFKRRARPLYDITDTVTCNQPPPKGKLKSKFDTRYRHDC